MTQRVTEKRELGEKEIYRIVCKGCGKEVKSLTQKWTDYLYAAHLAGNPTCRDGKKLVKGV